MRPNKPPVPSCGDSLFLYSSFAFSTRLVWCWYSRWMWLCFACADRLDWCHTPYTTPMPRAVQRRTWKPELVQCLRWHELIKMGTELRGGYVKRRRGELTFMPVEAMIEYGRRGWLGRICYLGRTPIGRILRILTGERAMKWCRGR